MKRIFYTFGLMLLWTSSLVAQTYLVDDFNYTSNDSLNSNGWVITSGATTNALRATATGLTYSGRLGSGVGPAVPLATSGQDICKDGNTTVSSGAIYTSFLMNVSAAGTGDYFYGFLPSGSTTAYFARTYIKAMGSGFQIGVSKASSASLETTVYQTDTLAFSTTYLVVLKYQFNSVSATDDSIKVFAFSSGIPATEPAVGKAATIGGTNTDAANLTRVFIRQGSAGAAPTLVLDGIRVGATWVESTLPVKWASFTANKNADATTLKWITASETNNSHFEIQRSNDGKNFETIGRVKGAGNSSRTLSYNFNDKDVATSTATYYRLKQVDFNGKADYSRTVSVVNTNNTKAGIGATLPNPFNNDLAITLNASVAAAANVTIMDMIGKTHHTSTEQLQQGSNTININTSEMPDGIYFVRVSYNGETFTQKVIKK